MLSQHEEKLLIKFNAIQSVLDRHEYLKILKVEKLSIEFYRIILNQGFRYFRDIPLEYLNEEIINEAVMVNREFFKEIDDNFKTERTCLIGITPEFENPTHYAADKVALNIKYIPERLQSIGFVSQMLETNRYIWTYLEDTFFEEIDAHQADEYLALYGQLLSNYTVFKEDQEINKYCIKRLDRKVVSMLRALSEYIQTKPELTNDRIDSIDNLFDLLGNLKISNELSRSNWANYKACLLRPKAVVQSDLMDDMMATGISETELLKLFRKKSKTCKHENDARSFSL